MREFLANPEWDAPFFKQLAHNDTGQAAGHQGGMVLPKDLRNFLPSLDEAATSRIAPTTDRFLRVEMFIGTAHLVESVVRYQFQTWGGTRPAESRLTEGFLPIRNKAAEQDLILFQRRADAVDYFRFILVKQGTPEFQEVNQWVNGRRWGALFVTDAPVTQSQLTQARTEIAKLAEKPFTLVKSEIARVETRQRKVARGSAFSVEVRWEYIQRCAITGIDISTPTKLFEVESAHIVPLSEGGSDDIRNGLALTQTVHWAFDHGLIGVLPDRTIYIPRQVKRMSENAFLKQFEKKRITEAKTASLKVHPDAFSWHLDNKVRQWD
jgi:putative restriction endonuclease